MSESLEQTTLISILRKKYKVVHSIPNGGKMSVQQRAKLAREGELKGIPDIFIPQLLLYIEMKAEKGRLSPEQKLVIAAINDTTPCTAIVAWGYKDALEKIAEFELSRDPL